MLMWWPPYRSRVLAEADDYVESFGDRAYYECRSDCIKAIEVRDKKRRRFLADVRGVLAKRVRRDRWLDTATRYLEQPQASYDHGPGYVAHRPNDSTLH